MASAKKTSNQLLQFLIIFLGVYLGSQFIIKLFYPSSTAQNGAPQILVVAGSSSYNEGNDPVINVTNNTASGFTLASRCPNPPFDVFVVTNVGLPTEKLTPVTATGTAVPCVAHPTIPAGAKAAITMAPWKYSLFAKQATYELRLPQNEIPKPVASGSGVAAVSEHPTVTRFAISEPGPFTKLFRAIITKPFLNFLIFVASLTPGYNLGIAIIILTLVVKLLLFIPTQRSLESQKKMQMLQPKLDELKRIYANDAKKQQEETMRLWKEHGINPFGACLPTLIQLPVLIGLLFVIRDGSHLELSRHLIYSFYQHLTWSFGTSFLWLDLFKPDFYVMPVVLVVLQFLQMKMTFAIEKRKKAKQNVIDVGNKKDKAPASAQDMQQKMMLYIFPLMIGFFAFQFPSAVSLYWGVSTLFAIGQQAIVNREHLRV